VSVGDREISLKAMQSCIKYLPVFLGLTANSAKVLGKDSGVKSWRRIGKMSGIPNTGMPKFFENYGQYRDYCDTMINRGLIRDHKMLWWDIRLSEAFETVELRICDLTEDVRDAAALADFYAVLLMQAAAEPADYYYKQVAAVDIVEQNIFAAGSYGLNAEFIDVNSSEQMNLAAYIAKLVQHNLPYAEKIGRAASLRRILTMIEQQGTDSTNFIERLAA